VTMKMAAVVSYQGLPFCGWQIQNNGPTIQGEVEQALYRITGEATRIIGAGRTDSGVHARGQVCSFELSQEWIPSRLVSALNAHLPESVRVHRAYPVTNGFDARRSALWREYIYFIWTGNSCFPHIKSMVWDTYGSWEPKVVGECCRIFQGIHDFSAFCKSKEVPPSGIREIISMKYRKRGNLSYFRIRGNAFLNNMVRIMVGSIHMVVTGKRDPAWLSYLLSGASRTESGQTAPARGLFLWKVGYRDFIS